MIAAHHNYCSQSDILRVEPMFEFKEDRTTKDRAKQKSENQPVAISLSSKVVALYPGESAVLTLTVSSNNTEMVRLETQIPTRSRGNRGKPAYRTYTTKCQAQDTRSTRSTTWSLPCQHTSHRCKEKPGI